MTAKVITEEKEFDEFALDIELARTELLHGYLKNGREGATEQQNFDNLGCFRGSTTQGRNALTGAHNTNESVS
jgi:hypothetical protein